MVAAPPNGGKVKNDRVDSLKIVTLLRSVPGVGKVLSMTTLRRYENWRMCSLQRG